MKPELELYLHFPFCARKCAYCDFFSGAFSDAEMHRYFEDLRAEIRARKDTPLFFPSASDSASFDRFPASSLPVRSVFIGGGTPSIVPIPELEATVDALREAYRIDPSSEFTIEANPGTLTPSKLSAYRALGVNRLSIGLQSPDDRMLQKLGRIHDFRTFLASYEAARRAGFDNISIDLISGLPGEMPDSFEKGLKTVLSLSPEHLSVYSLIIEENTPFYALYGPSGSRRSELPDEEADRLIYHRTGALLEDAGLHRYEISNYARPGFESRHNTGYWTGVPYLGFGAAAASFTGVSRMKNASSLSYRSLQPEENESLTTEDLMSEFMILGLRMTAGVSEAEFESRFRKKLRDAFSAAVSRHLALGTLEASGGFLRLTPYGLDVANAVMADFL